VTHLGREVGQLGHEFVLLRSERRDLVAVGVQLHQPAPGAFGPGEHAVDVGTVGAGQACEVGLAVLGDGKPDGVGFHPRRVGREVGGDVGEQNRDLVEPAA
jgi:hypothetical protein